MEPTLKVQEKKEFDLLVEEFIEQKVNKSNEDFLPDCDSVIIMVRHGHRLDCNFDAEDEEKQIYGQPDLYNDVYDTPLSKKGHEKATIVGQFLQEKILTRFKKYKVQLWSSPYLRCVQTVCGISQSLRATENSDEN